MIKRCLHIAAFAALSALLAFGAEPQGRNSEFTPIEQVFPHVAIGGVWASEITLVNLDDEDDAVFPLRFYQPDGSPWVMTIPGLGTNSEWIINLAPGETGVYTPNWPGETIETGWGQIEQPGDVQVAGHIIFTDGTPDRPVFEAVVPLSKESEWFFVMPFDNTEGNVSCIALANPTGAKVWLSLEFSNNDNELIDIDTNRSLGSRQQQAFCLPGEYPPTANQRGTIKVIGSDDFLSALGFRFNSGGAFATMFPMTSSRPVDQEDDCFDMVQGIVPWRSGGSANWGSNNLRRLCAGTTDPEATIACFSRGIEEHDDWTRATAECTYVAPALLEQKCFDLVQGRVPWNTGGTTSWAASNVDSLCADTPNPLATIACFSRGIDDLKHWTVARDECAGP